MALRSHFQDGVELVGHYSNPDELYASLGRLLRLHANAGQTRSHARNKCRHGSPPTDIERLVPRYRTGTPINDLAAEFEINRTTVMKHIERMGGRDGVASCSTTSMKHAASTNKAGHSPDSDDTSASIQAPSGTRSKTPASRQGHAAEVRVSDGDPARMNPASVPFVTLRGICLQVAYGECRNSSWLRSES